MLQPPGRLPRHYAPRTPVVLCSDPSLLPFGGRRGLLCLEKPPEADDFAAVEVLSEQGDLHEAAASLFAAMHRLDGLDLDFIVAQPLPGHGIGQAVMDRLTRASAQRLGDLAMAARKGACDGL